MNFLSVQFPVSVIQPYSGNLPFVTLPQVTFLVWSNALNKDNRLSSEIYARQLLVSFVSQQINSPLNVKHAIASKYFLTLNVFRKAVRLIYL